MKSRNLTKYSYVLFVLILIACLTISIVSFVAPQQTAYADSEYGAQLVNFNQYVLNGNFVNTQNWSTENGVTISVDNSVGSVTSVYTSSGIYQNSNSIIIGHQYYAFYSMRSGTNSNLLVNVCGNTNSIPVTSNFVKYDKLVTASTNRLIGIYVNTGNSGFEVTNVCVIDLTQMYGSNIPTLEQCRNIFVANYYNYNTGEPMYEYNLSSMGSLGELYKSSYTIYSSDWLKNDVYETYTRQNTTTGYTEIYTDILASDEVRLASVIYTFTTRIPAGAIITFDFKNLTCTGNVNIYSNDEGGQFLLFLGTRTQPSNSKTKIVTTNSVMQIQLLFGGTGINTPTISYENLTITAEYITTQNELIEGAYASGQQAMEDYYTSPNAGYQKIFNLGKNYGQRLAEQTAGATTGNAWDFISSTLTSLGSFFSIELMPNVTLGTFIAIPLLFGVLFFILKITRGE